MFDKNVLGDTTFNFYYYLCLIKKSNMMTDSKLFISVDGKVLHGVANRESINSVNIPEGIESIYEFAFSNCHNLRYVQLPKTLKTIGRGAFGGTGLPVITIPEGVTEIGFAAFFNSRIQRVIIPSTIRKIEDQLNGFAGEVFLFLTDLTQLEIELGHQSFGDLYVPSKILEACKQHPVLGRFRKIDSIENVIASMKLRYDRYW